MPELTAIANLGVAGLAVFLMYNLTAGAIRENTKAIKCLTDMIERLKNEMRHV